MYDDKVSYFEDDKWRYFFRDELANLYASVEGFLELRDEIRGYLDGNTVNKVMSEKDFYRNVFFGGLQGREDKPFVDNGLANFYRNGLGISIGDTSLVISRMKDGASLESSVEGVPETSYQLYC